MSAPADEGGGTDSIQADAGGDLTMLNRGGDAIHTTVDVVGEVDVIKTNTNGDGVQVPVEMGPEMDNDEEGGGDEPIPDEKEAGFYC